MAPTPEERTSATSGRASVRRLPSTTLCSRLSLGFSRIPAELWRGELGYLAAISPAVHRLALELTDRLADTPSGTTAVPPEIACRAASAPSSPRQPDSISRARPWPRPATDLNSIRGLDASVIWMVFAFLSPAGHTGVVTADQLEMISTDPQVMHGQAVIAGTRVPVSVILDCLAAGMTAEEITAEYPTVAVAGVRAAAAYGAALAREESAPATAVTVKFKLDENLPVSSAAILTSVGHDVDTVADEGLVGAPDRDVVAAATAAGRILISLDRGLGDIRAYPPGSHADIVVLRLTDQSAAAATRAVSDLATLTNPDSLAGAVAVLQRGLLRIRHP